MTLSKYAFVSVKWNYNHMGHWKETQQFTFECFMLVPKAWNLIEDSEYVTCEGKINAYIP